MILKPFLVLHIRKFKWNYFMRDIDLCYHSPRLKIYLNLGTEEKKTSLKKWHWCLSLDVLDSKTRLELLFVSHLSQIHFPKFSCEVGFSFNYGSNI